MQNTYLNEMAAAVEGMIANQEPHFLSSRDVETAALGFGKAVKRGAAEDGIVAISAQADVFLGVTVRDHSAVGTPANNPNSGYAVKESAVVMLKGVIWVISDEAITLGAAAYFNQSTGKFTDTAGTNCVIANGRFESAASAVDQLVKLRLV